MFFSKKRLRLGSSYEEGVVHLLMESLSGGGGWGGKWAVREIPTRLEDLSSDEVARQMSV